MSLYEAEFLGTPVPVKRRSKNDIQVPVVKRKRASKKVELEVEKEEVEKVEIEVEKEQVEKLEIEKPKRTRKTKVKDTMPELKKEEEKEEEEEEKEEEKKVKIKVKEEKVSKAIKVEKENDDEPPAWFKAWHLNEAKRHESSKTKKERAPAPIIKKAATSVAKKQWKDGFTRDKIRMEQDSHQQRLYNMIHGKRF